MRRLIWALVPLLLMARPRPVNEPGEVRPGGLVPRHMPDTPPPGVSPEDFHPTPDAYGGPDSYPSPPEGPVGPTPAPAPQLPHPRMLPDAPPPGVSRDEFDRTTRGGRDGGFWSLPIFGGGIFGLARAVRLEAQAVERQIGSVQDSWPVDPARGGMRNGPHGPASEYGSPYGPGGPYDDGSYDGGPPAA